MTLVCLHIKVKNDLILLLVFYFFFSGNIQKNIIEEKEGAHIMLQCMLVTVVQFLVKGANITIKLKLFCGSERIVPWA